MLTTAIPRGIIFLVVRQEYLRVCWNRQTGTFEGRVSSTYGFKSHHSHQKKENTLCVFFFLVQVTVLLVYEIHHDIKTRDSQSKALERVNHDLRSEIESPKVNYTHD